MRHTTRPTGTIPSTNRTRGAICAASATPCTTTVRGLASEVLLTPAKDPVPRECVASLDSVEQVSVAVLVQRVGRVSDDRMRMLSAALAVAVDC